MTTHFYQHPVCIDHQPGPHHPESPDRLRSVMAALSNQQFDDLKHFESPKTSPETIALMHDVL